MRKVKSILCVLMILTMVLSFTACGKDEKKEEVSGGADVSDVENIEDAVTVAGDYTQGKYSLVFDAEIEVEDIVVSGAISLDGKVNNGNASAGVGLKFDAQSLDISIDEELSIDEDLGDAFVIVDDMMYIDLDVCVDTMTGVETELGFFAVPMPEYDKDVQKELQDETMELVQGLIEAMLADVDVEKDGSTFSIEIKDAETVLAIAKGAVEYVSENKDKINEYYNSNMNSNTFDVQAYLESVLDYYRDDIKAAGEVMGQEITDDMIDSLLDEIEYEDMETGEIDVFGDVDFDSVLEEIENADVESLQAEMDEKGLVVEFSVTAEADKYEFDCTVSFGNEEGTGSIGISYTFEVEDVSISAPDKVASITDIVEFISENPEEIQNLYNGLMGVLEDWGLYDYLIGGNMGASSEAVMGY